MKKIGKLTMNLAVFGLVLALPFFTNAALLDRADCASSLGQACNTTSPYGLITTAIDILLGIAGLTAVLFIIIGGFQYITSAGNEELAEKGKKNLQNAIIGIVIIVLSFVIVQVISSALVQIA